MQERAWMASARCRSFPPIFFFPQDGAGVTVAMRACTSCPVKEECLEHALAKGIDHGVWGGASERQRRRIRVARESTRAQVIAL